MPHAYTKRIFHNDDLRYQARFGRRAARRGDVRASSICSSTTTATATNNLRRSPSRTNTGCGGPNDPNVDEDHDDDQYPDHSPASTRLDGHNNDNTRNRSSIAAAASVIMSPMSKRMMSSPNVRQPRRRHTSHVRSRSSSGRLSSSNLASWFASPQNEISDEEDRGESGRGDGHDAVSETSETSEHALVRGKRGRNRGGSGGRGGLAG